MKGILILLALVLLGGPSIALKCYTCNQTAPIRQSGGEGMELCMKPSDDTVVSECDSQVQSCYFSQEFRDGQRTIERGCLTVDCDSIAKQHLCCSTDKCNGFIIWG